MDEVWLVVWSSGSYSDYCTGVESVWDSDAGAISHIVRDLEAELYEPDSPHPGIKWVVRDPDGWDEEDVYYDVERKRLRHGS